MVEMILGVYPSVKLRLDRMRKPGEGYDETILRLLGFTPIKINDQTASLLSAFTKRVKADNMSNALEHVIYGDEVEHNCLYCMYYSAKWSPHFQQGQCSLTNQNKQCQEVCRNYCMDEHFDDERLVKAWLEDEEVVGESHETLPKLSKTH